MGNEITIAKTEVNSVIARANEYNKDNWDNGKLSGKDDAQTASTKAFLKGDPHPYDDAKIRQAIEHMLADAVKGKEEVQGTVTTVYLSGATGAKQMLLDAAGKANPDVAELSRILKTGIVSDFAVHKAQFTKYSGKDMTTEPYGKWRGLMSGIDTELEGIAAKEKRHFIMDNTMAPVDDKTAQSVRKAIAKEKESKHVQLFAVALGADEAILKAKELGISEHDAVQTATDFHAFFGQLKSDIPDLTLFDSEMKIIYQQKDGKVIPEKVDVDKMKKWDESFPKPEAKEELTVGPFSPDTKGLPQPKRQR